MNKIGVLILGLMITACEAPKSTKDAFCSNIAQLYGKWDVALLFDLNQPASSTTMELTGDGNALDDKSMFYGSQFEASEIASIPGHFVFSAQTSDGTGAYIHTARYSCSKDKIEGQTWSRGRDFLMTWTAERTSE